MQNNNTTPSILLDTFFNHFNSGHVDDTASLYEKSAAFVAQPAMVAEGTPAIREALAQFFAMRPRLAQGNARIIMAGDIALSLAQWTLDGTGPDGPIHMTGTATDVFRRQPDGTWQVVIDNPWGIAAIGIA
jgi:ketosteroid isomerase-like protein